MNTVGIFMYVHSEHSVNGIHTYVFMYGMFSRVNYVKM